VVGLSNRPHARWRLLGSVAVLALLTTACPGREPPAPPPPPQSPAPSETVSEARLEDRYYVDTDGNAVPDFIEAELGYDPRIDDCAQQTGCALPQGIPGATPTADQNVLVILDASGSMAGPAGGGQLKIDAAKRAIERYVVGTPDNYDLGLMVYGHIGSNQPQDKAASCAGIDVFAPLGELNVNTVGPTLARFGPNGYTPIAGSLDRATQVFTGTEGASNRVLLVTDGVETCDGDPVAAARRLKQANIAVTVDVVGFDIEGSDQEAALRAVADATGGTYTSAQDAEQLSAYFEDLLELQNALITAITCLFGRTNTAGLCIQTLARDAETRISAIQASETDPVRFRLLEETKQRINVRTLELSRLNREQGDALIDQLNRQLNDARRRYAERYGEEIGVLFCPREPLFA
jgi:hypothetical protein